MRKLSLVLGVLLAINGAMGCAKDRNLDDYNRQKAAQDLARYQAVQGSYRGVMNSSLENKAVGALQLNLTARMQANPAQDGSAAVGTPLLTTEVTFQDSQAITVSSQGDFYNPDNGNYTSNIKVTLSSGEVDTISIVGSIGGGHLTGTIQVIGFESQGGSFDLTLNGPSLTQLVQSANIAASANSDGTLVQLSAFSSGDTTFKIDGTVKPVRIVLLQPRTGGDQDFVNVISPKKTVTVSLNYDSSAHIPFMNALWDLRTGELTGQTNITQTVTTNGVATATQTVLSLDCNIKINGSAGAISCSHYTAELGVVATSQAKLETAPQPDPVDHSVSGNAVIKTYTGKFRWDNKSPYEKISMKVVYPARTRLDDLYQLFLPNAQKSLQVTVNFPEGTPVPFYSAQWDSSTGQLDAIDQPTVANPTPGPAGSGVETGWVPELHCTGFYFAVTHRVFNCQYSSNNRDGVIEMVMQP